MEGEGEVHSGDPGMTFSRNFWGFDEDISKMWKRCRRP